MAAGTRGASRIVLGVTGGVAAYKAADVARRLRERGLAVQTVLTANAQQFIAPLTFAALTGERVITDLFSTSSSEAVLGSSVEHIAVAERADLLLVAPATADILAKFAHGLADDFLTTMHLAFTGPVLVAPAMNVNMWRHPATVENLGALRARGVRVIEPDAGELACGMVGPGRLALPERIAEEVVAALAEGRPRDLAGRTLLLTAGPTQEAVDPVRFLSNRSSGKMGYALAAEALLRGARVILVSGPTTLEPPAGAAVEPVVTAEEMRQAVLRRLPEADIAILAAAVADYRPARPAAFKVKKEESPLSLELEPTADILAEVGRRKGGLFLVGFAAETEDLRENAARKLRAKNCDLLIANPVGPAAAGAGFDSDENEGLLLDAAGGSEPLPRQSKREMARRILDRVAAELARRTAA